MKRYAPPLATGALLLAAAALAVPLASALGGQSGDSPLIRDWSIHYRAPDGARRTARVLVPRGYGPGSDPAIPLVISPPAPGAPDATRMWGGFPAKGPFAVVVPLGAGAARPPLAPSERVAELAALPGAVTAALPWLQVDPKQVYALGAGPAGGDVLLLAASRPHLLAGAAAFDASGGGSLVAEAPALAHAEARIELWWSAARAGTSARGSLYGQVRKLDPNAVIAQSIVDRPLTGATLAASRLPAALLSFGLLPLQPFEATSFEAAVQRRVLAHVHESAVHAPFCDRGAGAQSTIARIADAATGYPWPLKPFDVQHPVRADFGDPRTLYRLTAPASARPVGRFTFHDGVDIVGRIGQAVYPVVSGRVVEAYRDAIYVRSGNRLFSYWHLRSAVTVGERVVAEQTVLGFIRPVWRHVHLSESLYGRDVDPLLHLTPYTDSTPPVVAGLRFTDPSGRVLDPLHLHGAVQIVAGTYDLPSPPVSGSWNGMPVTPALVRWRLTTADGRVVVDRTAADFRWTIPEGQKAFWRVYAHGTYQNFPMIGVHYFFQQPGNFLFRLTRVPFDTGRLVPGRYELTVEAADVCGNRGSLTEHVEIGRGGTAGTARAGGTSLSPATRRRKAA